MDNVSQLENDLRNIDPIELLSPNEVFDDIKIFDSTIEIIGYVDGIESPRLVGDKLQYKFYKFYQNNGIERRVQVVAWNDDISKIEHKLTSNSVFNDTQRYAKGFAL